MTRIAGGIIDRSIELNFSFDGIRYRGHPGDTLASALLANGVRLMGRSFKYHRPRGVISAGSEEPNALVELRTGARQEPNTRATVAELFDGLEARSQNRWPSLAFDAMAINDWCSNLLTAGFYYKTFMWPKAFWEKVYEPMIRKAAGLGNLSGEPDPDQYDKGFLHCDLLVIGGGPAGLAAALTAGRAGADVILADDDFAMGGRLLVERHVIDNGWLVQTLFELHNMANVRMMSRTTVFGTFDHGIHGAVEKVCDHLPTPTEGKPRQTLWRIYAKRSLNCTGATERPIAFRDNDRPGIMLAGALRAYANRWAVAVDQRVTVFTNNDDGHRTARDLVSKGLQVTLIDTRGTPRLAGVDVLHGVVIGSRGRLCLRSISVRLASGEIREIQCGALGMSGGWNPNVHLGSHHGGRPIWNDQIAAFCPSRGAAGSAAGKFSTRDVLASGVSGAIEALATLGITAPKIELPEAENECVDITPMWHVPGKGRAWLDFQNDVTVKDVKLAHQENFRSVEHLKRYTTLGMATDQGKTANTNALAVMAELTGRTISDTGTTIYRPPFTPVPIATFAGSSRGRNFRPYRLTPAHKWAEEQGAVFSESGNWLRADYFKLPGETTWRESVDREVRAVRSAVGICDVSTLGKIDVQGHDAAEFLNRVYCNTIATLPVGRTRYGLMLREDGIVRDDGTVARLAHDHFVLTSTTANAASVLRHMEFCHQCLWPELDVHLIAVTDAWAQFAVAGPKSRDLLTNVVEGIGLSNEQFPFMACAEITVASGLPARLFRISFSGEHAYEIAVPSRYGDALVRRLMVAGRAFGVTPYGTEALGVLRIEKGHPAGAELNGRTTAANLGLGKMVSLKKDSIGMVLSQRKGLKENEHRLVGLQPVDRSVVMLAGSHLMNAMGVVNASRSQGWVSSVCYSPHVGQPIALGFLMRGEQRHGEVIRVVDPVASTEAAVRVVSPHFIDPEGVRLRV
ncbi:sarcosine oxidase subunit alpha family protein [Sinorhizobium meliloti]|uniref:sarcosine oxidase subunit alpha family protein n=1 Tax=Rhizobium meliloti TaxID=382 RepID=UPI000FDB1B39|nr:sarcosine oxidase subunit alpha family protein [Sinorhizobium meliloti]MDW9924835.1 sarcosine oxidase subunit alpha family protein [Sinorhizobium meliloti]MDX0036137.1 sarcosine oxidase subunit alpha family protein [Sinorhizobium meliloti]RVK27935.1 sarcosine oxidase subunit alpha family protein [Sinorhizobium meliloti]